MDEARCEGGLNLKVENVDLDVNRGRDQSNTNDYMYVIHQFQLNASM